MVVKTLALHTQGGILAYRPGEILGKGRWEGGGDRRGGRGGEAEEREEGEGDGESACELQNSKVMVSY